MFDQKLHGCFNGNGFFASQPADENRAFEWIKDLRDGGIGWKAARKQIVECLTSKGFDAEHIYDQVERAAEKLKPWLI